MSDDFQELQASLKGLKFIHSAKKTELMLVSRNRFQILDNVCLRTVGGEVSGWMPTFL